MSKSMLKIIVIHGFLAREHMQRHWYAFLKQQGFDVSLCGHMESADKIAQQLKLAHAQGQKIVIIGYSQGGFQAVKIARALNKLHTPVHLLVTLAAGGKGRWLPTQWGFNPRVIPANVAKAINYFSLSDSLGTDRVQQRNLIRATSTTQQVENIVFSLNDAVSHIAISRCFPEHRLNTVVKSQLIARVQAELAILVSNESNPV